MASSEEIVSESSRQEITETFGSARRPPVHPDHRPRLDVEACWLGMKMILNASEHTFKCRETLPERTDVKYSGTLQNVLKSTYKYHETRYWLGTSSDLWGDYTLCLEAAVIQIQDLYQLPRGSEPSEETFTALVIKNANRTQKDLQRLIDLIMVARNMLADCPMGQRYAVETTCHHEIFNLIQICIEFNSEGFAGEAGSPHEQIFGRTIALAKKLLVQCLQCLFNLLRAGKDLRTRIWLELLCLDTEFNAPTPHTQDTDVSPSYKQDVELSEGDFDRAAEKLLGTFSSPSSGRTLRELLADLRILSSLQLHLDKMHNINLINFISVAKMDVSEDMSVKSGYRRIEAAKRALAAPLDLMLPDAGQTQPQDNDQDVLSFGNSFYPTEQDFIYQKGLPASPYNLSEIPIILAPSGEIEALVMLIMQNVMATDEVTNLEEKDRLDQAIRCFFLVRSTTGRMLLRELYIFIAAWDLPEDELFFKGMVNITKSFHQHDLLYDVYDALADPKDIISPGQNILIKLLHHMFKSVSDPAEIYEQRSAKLKKLDANVIRFLLSKFRNNILPRALAIIWLQGQVRDGVAAAEDFERANLNLWDMERTYEGVYQFLELFSALNDNPVWKKHCVQLETAWDIVELIRYLHKHVPVQPLVIPPPPQQLMSRTSSEGNYPAPPRATSLAGDRVAPLERPYSPAISNQSAPSQTGRRRMPLSQAQPDSPPPSTPTTPQPPHTYPWRNLKKMAILVLSGLLYNAPTLRAKIREYDGVLLIASCSEHDENNPYIKEHAVLCLKLLLEGDRENQRLVEDLRAREVRSAPGLESLGYKADVDETGRVRVWHTTEDEQGQREEVLLPVVPGETQGIIQQEDESSEAIAQHEESVTQASTSQVDETEQADVDTPTLPATTQLPIRTQQPERQ